MMFAVARVMFLGLLRDKAALALAFVLPPAIFVIFASIFAGASGEELRLKVSIADEARTSASIRLVEAVRADTDLRVIKGDAGSGDKVRAAVKSGAADVGLVIRGDPASAGASEPIVVIADAGKAMAGPMLAGMIQRTIGEKLPDVALRRSLTSIEQLVGGFSPQQIGRSDAAVNQIARETTKPTGGGLVAMEASTKGGAGRGTIAYYAGAVAVMFLLFAAMQSAVTLIEERQSGIVDRLLLGPGGPSVIVLGKALFLVVQGLLQIGLIFLVAWLVYGVDVPAAFAPFVVTSVLVATMGAAIALLVASLCSTRQQANTFSSFFVLIVSAIGGSMVPHFMMPPWLQEIGWFTPNAWAIEAYHGAIWRGETWQTLMPVWGVLAGIAVVSLVGALATSRALGRT